ncbi:uncharacterized protein LOC129596771 [Paramacrobiotus metropolitanus]|uniref:uncharacterized protein LOC129596771 n=1 Tax=Paramacrobiotus metropolitanus TaxID=2943436 RepID=UPI002445CA5E|nr:uncharacterized protein LOC129596771 [Paramacrobiotus metropolitanus]
MDSFCVAAAVAVVMLSLVPWSTPCPSQRNDISPVDRLNQILNEAKHRNGHGTMHLHGYGRGPSLPRYPIKEWPPETEIIRAPEGGTLLIHCNNTKSKQACTRG